MQRKNSNNKKSNVEDVVVLFEHCKYTGYQTRTYAKDIFYNVSIIVYFADTQNCKDNAKYCLNDD